LENAFSILSKDKARVAGIVLLCARERGKGCDHPRLQADDLPGQGK
jgi:hypothetical protein